MINSVALAPMRLPDTLCFMAKLTSIESEFATTEEVEAYDAWFRAEVEAAMASDEPCIPHDQMMAELRAIIAKHHGP